MPSVNKNLAFLQIKERTVIKKYPEQIQIPLTAWYFRRQDLNVHVCLNETNVEYAMNQRSAMMLWRHKYNGFGVLVFLE